MLAGKTNAVLEIKGVPAIATGINFHDRIEVVPANISITMPNTGEWRPQITKKPSRLRDGPDLKGQQIIFWKFRSTDRYRRCP